MAGSNPARRQSCGGKQVSQGSKRVASQMLAEVTSAPLAKQAKKQAPTLGQVEELLSPSVLEFLKKNGITKASIEPVLEGVKHSQSGLPKDVRDMLLATLLWSLAVPVDKRHESQQDVVLMVDGVFKNVQAELQRAVDVETGKVDELKAEQAELANTAERAVAASCVARSVMEDQEKAQAHASSTVVEARKASQAAEREEARLRNELLQTRSLRLELEEALSGSFRRLKDAEFEDGEVDSLLQTVMAAGAKSGMEEALRTTLPICLAKRERGAFEQTVVCEAEQCIQGKVVALSEVVEATAALVESQAEVAREARAAVDVAVVDQSQVADRLCSAQAQACEAAAMTEAAKIATTEFGTKLVPALEVQGARQGEFDHFHSYNMFLFALLRDRTTEKDVAKEPTGTVDGALLPASLAGA